MAFRDFTFPEVQHDLGLTLAEAALYSGVPPLSVREDFAALIREGTDLALAVSTEKARSEFIIAPILFETRRLLHGSFGLFSGVEFNVDPARGLNGYCDFILTKNPMQMVLTAPLVAIAEAKNDNIRNGLGQCIAAMVAALEFNKNAKTPIEVIYGVVTTGSAWKFLQLRGNEITADIHEYLIVDVGKIMGILMHMLRATV